MHRGVSYVEMGLHIGDGKTVMSWVIHNHQLIEKYLDEIRKEQPKPKKAKPPKRGKHRLRR